MAGASKVLLLLLLVPLSGCMADPSATSTAEPPGNLLLSATNTGLSAGWFWIQAVDDDRGNMALDKVMYLQPGQSGDWTLPLDGTITYTVDGTASTNSVTRADGITMRITNDGTDCPGMDTAIDFRGYAGMGDQPGWSTGFELTCSS